MLYTVHLFKRVEVLSADNDYYFMATAESTQPYTRDVSIILAQIFLSYHAQCKLAWHSSFDYNSDSTTPQADSETSLVNSITQHIIDNKILSGDDKPHIDGYTDKSYKDYYKFLNF